MRKLLSILCCLFMLCCSSDSVYGKTRMSKVVHLTIMKEESQNLAGQLAIYGVIVNRSLLSGKTLERVCLEPSQFSCWNRYRGSRTRVSPERSIPKYVIDFSGIEREGDVLQILKYATHYHNPKKVRPRYYYDKNCIRLGRIGDHVFYCFSDEYEELQSTIKVKRSMNLL